MAELINIVLAVFAIYRISSLVASEEGPYLPFLYKDEDQNGIFKWLRTKLGAYDKAYNEEGNYLSRTNLGRGVSCSLCVGFYITIFILILMSFPNRVFTFFIMGLGIWGVQTFLENLTSDDAIKGAIQEVAENMDDDEDKNS